MASKRHFAECHFIRSHMLASANVFDCLLRVCDTSDEFEIEVFGLLFSEEGGEFFGVADEFGFFFAIHLFGCRHSA